MGNKGQQFGSSMWGEGMQKPSTFERKYPLPTKSKKPEVKSTKTSQAKIKEGIQSPEKKFWSFHGKTEKAEILKRFKGKKGWAVDQLNIGETELLKYADEVFKLGTGYGHKESLKKEIMKLEKEATSGETATGQVKARQRLRLLKEVFGKDLK